MLALSAGHIVLLVVLLLGLAAVVWLSAAALGGATRRQRVALVALRAGLFASLLLAVVDPQWVRAHRRTRLPLIAILVDTSRSMSIADAPGSTTRIEQARALVNSTQERLRSDADVLLWSFDARARLAQPSALEAAGAGTDIAGALRALQRHVDTERLSGVWLLTDGRDLGAEEGEAATAAALLGVPVNIVAIGSEQQPPDVELWSVLAPKSMRAGERALAVATVRAPGYGGQQVNVVLQSHAAQSNSAKVTIDQSGTATARFALAPKQPGAGAYEVRVAPLEGELTKLNNARTFVVSVKQGDRRVLLVDRPRPEFKFLRRALEGLKGVETDTYVQKAPNGGFWLEGEPPKRAALPVGSALRQYDAIVIGDVPAKVLPAEFVRGAADFVAERGGGLGLLGGQQSFGVGGYAETAIADVLPLRLGGTLDGYFPSALQLVAAQPADGHPLLASADGMAQWSRLPVLEGANLTRGPTPLAEVLLEGLATSGRKVPILAVRQVGPGRSLCLTSDSTFRWVFSEYATDASAQAHAALWQRALRWLSTSSNERPVSVALDRTQCTVGDRVRVIATVLDEDFAPVADAQVAGTVTGPDNKKSTVQCYPTADAGRYEGSVRATAAGRHAIRVLAKRRDEQLGSDAGEFVAHAELAELRDVRLDRPLLQRIAEASGGEYHSAEGAENAMTKPLPAAQVSGYRRVSATRSWPYLLLVLLLCGLDWGLRRRWHAA